MRFTIILFINICMHAGTYIHILHSYYLYWGRAWVGHTDSRLLAASHQICEDVWVACYWCHLGTQSFWFILSPTGEKIRSKVELTRYLGPACDLTLFDFRQGTLCHPIPKVLDNVGTDARAIVSHGTRALIYVLLVFIFRLIPWLSPARRKRSLLNQPRLRNSRLGCSEVRSG